MLIKSYVNEVSKSFGEISGSLNDVTGSLYESVNPQLDQDIKTHERVMVIMAREIDRLKEKLHNLENKKIIEETQIPLEILKENKIIIPFKKRFTKRGRGFKPILKWEIEEAQKQNVNESAAARWLGVNFLTYKHYAKKYGLYNPKPCIKGKRELLNPFRGKYSLYSILEGKHPNLPSWTVKDKLIRSGMKKMECELCGYSQTRLDDGQAPLLLNHLDGDIHNHKIENLRIYCYNCSFVAGGGYVRKDSPKFDPDYIQRIYSYQTKKYLGKPVDNNE